MILVLLCNLGDTYQPASPQAIYDAEVAPYYAFQSDGKFQPSFVVAPWQQAGPQSTWWQAVDACVAAHNPPLVDGYVVQSSQNITTQSVATPNYWLTIQGQVVSVPLAFIRAGDMRNPALIAHEFGHMLGLGHTNNSDGDADTYDNPWDLMSGAFQYAVRYNTTGWKPKSLAAVHRKQLGWIEHSLTLTEGTHEVQLVPVGEFGVQLIQVGALSIEAKRRRGYDAALPYEGVVVYNGVLLEDAADYSNGPGSVLTFGETRMFGNVTVTVADAVTVIVDPTLFNNGFEP